MNGVDREPFRAWLQRQAGRNHPTSIVAHTLGSLDEFPWDAPRHAMLRAVSELEQPKLEYWFEGAYREYLARGGLQPRSLGYVWSVRAGGWSLPELTPWLPRGAMLRLHVGDVPVWEGRVDKDVWSWAVWCAARMAPLWDCPPDVLRFFARQSRSTAAKAASAIERMQARMQSATPEAAKATLDLAKMPGNPESKAIVASCAAAKFPEIAGPRRIQERHAMARQLRAVLLQRVVPRKLWGLLEQKEAVLVDYLLENCQAV